jgi:hypothetical protein
VSLGHAPYPLAEMVAAMFMEGVVLASLVQVAAVVVVILL